MEEHSVHNLIKKFETLSNKICSSIKDISRSPHFLQSKFAKQPFVGTPFKHIDESLVKIPAFGRNTNTTVIVENRVRFIEQMLKNNLPDDKMALLTVYNEMMDAFIQLDNIGGLDSMKAKKACYLIELRNIKEKIKELIAPPGATTQSTGEMVDNAVTPMTSSVVLDTQSAMPCVKSLVTKFSFPNEDRATPMRSPTFQNLVKKFDALAAGIVDEHTKSSNEYLMCNVNLQQLDHIDFSKIVNELEHYSASIADIDPDDYIRIELIEEYMNGIAPLLENNSLATKCMHELSMKIETLKSGRSLKTEDFGAFDRQSCEHSDTLTTDFCSTAIIPEVGSEVTDGNDSVDEDHLESSIHQIYHYTRLMHSYVNNQDVLQYEAKINDEYQFLSHFNPHVAVLRQWKELTQAYKDLLELISGWKSEREYKDVADENKSENTILLDKVKASISKCNEIIESIDLSKADNVDILTMNLEEVLHDFGKIQNSAQSERAKFLELLKTVVQKLKEI